MFLRLIFKRLGFKENKYILASAYGVFYFGLVLLVLTFAGIYLKNLILARIFFISLILGIIMFFVYLVKWEIFKFR